MKYTKERIYDELTQNAKKSVVKHIMKTQNLDEEMIYMITEKYTKTLKVGYSSNFLKRMANYRTHTTLFEILDAKNAVPVEETYYQDCLIELGFKPHYAKGGGIEWFDIPADIPKSRLKNGFLSLDNLIMEATLRKKGIDIWAEA
jgi:hypothetical protein